MSLLLTAVGLVLFIEGLFYSGFPSLVKKNGVADWCDAR